MKKILPLIVFLITGLACQLNVDMGAPKAAQTSITQTANTQVAVTQIVNTPAPNSTDVFIQADGRSSLAISSELLPYLTRLDWMELEIMENEIIVGAPEGLGLRENGLAYHIAFTTGYGRSLALVTVEMYFVPEQVGTPFDEVYMFSGLNRDSPGLSVYQDVEGHHQTTFRGAYTFAERLNVNEFVAYLNFYAAMLDQLLVEYPFFSKQ